MRITAAVIVVFYHYTAWGHNYWGEHAPQFWPVLSQFTRYGQIGVQLFFLISGFVILMSLQGRSLTQFIGSRVGRLYPAYWLAVLLAAVLTFGIWPGVADGRSVADILPNLTMMQAAGGVRDLDGVYWTLWVELRFYILLGLLLLFGLIRNKHIMWLSLLWPVAGLYLHFTSLEKVEEWVAGEYAALFCAGMMLFLIYQNGHTVLRWVLVVVNTGIAAYFTGLKGSGDASYLSGLQIPQWHFQLLAIGCVIVLALCTLTPLNRIESKWLAVAGSLTFPLYLFHQLWGWWFISQLHGVLNRYVLLFGLIMLMMLWAYVVARFIERPLGLFLRRVTVSGLSRGKLWVNKSFGGPVTEIRESIYRQSLR